MRGHARRRSRRRHPVARRVLRRSVAVAVSCVAVGSVGDVSVAVSMPGVAGASADDVPGVGQGLHVDRGIAESDSRG